MLKCDNRKWWPCSVATKSFTQLQGRILVNKVRQVNLRIVKSLWSITSANPEQLPSDSMSELTLNFLTGSNQTAVYACRRWVEKCYVYFNMFHLHCIKQIRTIYRVSQEECARFREGVPKLKYTDITQNTYVQSWTVTEIMAREKCGLLAGPRTVTVSWQSYPFSVLECGVIWRQFSSS